jgi:transposase
MRFYTTPHPFYCGIDLHARTMSVCLLDQHRAILVHRHMQTSPEACLNVIAPYRPGLVVAVECMFPWYWLADLCADEGIPFVLGPALYMQAIQGGKAQNDPIDSHKMAARRRGGMLPPSSVSPAALRATRDLLRRRRPLAHQRAALRAHGHNTKSQSTLPALGTKIASQANRDGVAERCAAPAVHKRLAGDLARITSDDALLRDIARPIVTTATHHDAHTLSRRHTVPGIGTIRRLVWLDDIPAIDRFPRVQDVVASGRLGTWATSAAGQRLGTSGAKIGQAHLQWAFAEAAVLCLSDHPAAHTYRTRVEKQPDQGKA